MKTRLLAAAVGLGILLPALFWGGVLAVDILVGAVMVVLLTEYTAMAFPEDRNASMGFMSLSLAACAGIPLYTGAGHWGPAWMMTCVATLMYVVFRPGPDLSRAADRFARLYAGTIWLSLLVCIPMLRRLDEGLAWVFLVLAISWCGDTGGYFAGRFFGRTKLYPLISPKKTWEGVVGGVLFAVGGVFVVRHLGLPQLTATECVVLGVGLCGVGVIGDLGESMMKRSFDVKDSGWIMPGHGGLLDRVDSVLFVAPFVYAFAMYKT